MMAAALWPRWASPQHAPWVRPHPGKARDKFSSLTCHAN